jgi:hypothetical protein
VPATFKTGSFAKTTSTATLVTQAITGVGFQPNAVILYTAGVAGANSAGVSTDGFTFATGFTDTALNKRATVMACNDNVGTSQTRRRAVNNQSLCVINGSGAFL